MVAAWLEINVGILTHSHHLLTIYKHKVSRAHHAGQPCQSRSSTQKQVASQAGDVGYVAVKHVLSTLFIEHILPPLVINIPSFSLTSCLRVAGWRNIDGSALCIIIKLLNQSAID